MTSKRLALLMVLACSVLVAGGKGGRAEYVGGTISRIPDGCEGRIQAIDEHYFVFYSGKASWRIPYEQINLLEYGQKVDRRYLAAVLVSPLFLLAKKRDHFLTVGYSDDNHEQQAMIFKVDKNDVRAILVSLEARTGRRVEYQDDDARNAGKG
jgi:hypothetical protein